LPVVKKKGPAQAGVTSHTPAVIIADTKLTRNLMSLLLFDVLVLNHWLQFLKSVADSPRSVFAAFDDRYPGRHALPFT
jgi:hypothetical protein